MNLKTLMTGCAAGCALVLAAAPAFADGLYSPSRAVAPEPYVPVQTFAGFYIGGHVGAAFGQIDGVDRDFGFDGVDGALIYLPFRTNDLNGSNVFGGVQFGYNYTGWSNFLFGIEVDIGGMGKVINDQDVTVVSPISGDPRRATLALHSDGGWYGDVTGRLGYSWGPALLYAKGGFAWFDPNVTLRARFMDASGTWFDLTNNHDSETLTGWTVGGGFEYSLGGPWTVKLEYLHFDFSDDNNDHCCLDGLNDFRFNNRDLTVDTVKVGFNYLFRPEAPIPLK